MADVIVEQADRVLSLTLNRPECGNLITMPMIKTITQTLRDVSRDTNVVVFRAAGADFCKGRDYARAPEDAAKGEIITAATIRETMTSPVLAMYTAIKELSVPCIAVVQGAALGFGCAFPCACDIVLAGAGAKFGLPELHERGLPPTLAMTALLDRVSLRMLTYLAYSSTPIDARTAQAAGLISAVYDDAHLSASAGDVIAGIASRPAEGIRAICRYLRLAPYMEPRGRAEFGANLFAVAAASR